MDDIEEKPGESVEIPAEEAQQSVEISFDDEPKAEKRAERKAETVKSAEEADERERHGGSELEQEVALPHQESIGGCVGDSSWSPCG